MTQYDGVQVDSILIDQTKFGEAVRQGRASNFDLPVALGLELADRALEISLDKPGVGSFARDDILLAVSLIVEETREGKVAPAAAPAADDTCRGAA